MPALKGLRSEEDSTSRFGRWPRVPGAAGSGRILTAVGIDSLGNGMLLSFQVLYLTAVVDLNLAQVSAALTCAQLVALTIPIPAGRLVDRWGPKVGSAAGDLLCAAGYTGLLLAGSFWAAIISCTLIQVGVALYWTANGPLIAQVAPADRRVTWFGMVQAIRNAGIGIGGALAALAVAWSERHGLRLLVLVDVVSYVAAAALVLSWTAPRPEAPSPQPDSAPSATPADPDVPDSTGRRSDGYGAVLRDRVFLRFLAVNLVFVLAALVPGMLLAVYLTEVLHHGAWLAGALLTLNTVLIASLQTTASRRIESLPTGRVLVVGSAVNATAFLLFAGAGLVPVGAVGVVLVAAMVVLTAAEMLTAPVTGAVAVSLAPPALRGRYQALVQMTWNIGGVAAPGLLLGLLQIQGQLPWAVLAVLSLLATVLISGLRTPGPSN